MTRIDGRAIAEEIYAELASNAAGARLTLGIIAASSDAATKSFLKVKEQAAKRLGVTVRRVDLSSSATTGEVINAIASLSEDADGIVVQLPLPENVHTETVLMAIPSERDVDALNFIDSETDQPVVPPVVGAVLEVLKRAYVDVRGKRVAVVGAGRLVGAPAALALEGLGADVFVVTRSKGNLHTLKEADVVISGVGSPHFIKPDMVKEGAVLIDAGTSESNGGVAGDIDPASAEKASIFTPTPGGIGPITVAVLFRNLFLLAGRKSASRKRASPKIAQKRHTTRSAGGIVVNADGDVLVVNQGGNSWSLPKGHIDDGEDALAAAKREIYEESGVRRLELVRELGSYTRSRIGLRGGEDTSEVKTITMFLFKTNERALKPIDPHNPEARWVKKEEVADFLTHQKDKEFFLAHKEEI